MPGRSANFKLERHVQHRLALSAFLVCKFGASPGLGKGKAEVATRIHTIAAITEERIIAIQGRLRNPDR
jgi:hypothetical protein